MIIFKENLYIPNIFRNFAPKFVVRMCEHAYVRIEKEKELYYDGRIDR